MKYKIKLPKREEFNLEFVEKGKKFYKCEIFETNPRRKIIIRIYKEKETFFITKIMLDNVIKKINRNFDIYNLILEDYQFVMKKIKK